MTSEMNLITTVIGFGMSATFIIFVCTRLICLRIRTAGPRTTTAATFEADFRSEPEHRASGLEPVIISTFPTMKFSSDTSHPREDSQCYICLGEYEEKELLRIMPVCRHDFHVSCIDTWLKQQSTCPVCRLALRDSIEAKQMISSMFSAIIESVHNSEAMSERSHQWLDPNHVYSYDSASNQESQRSVNGFLESRHAREAGTWR